MKARLKKGNWDRDCMICKRPFCVVKWIVVCGDIRKTELCHSCSELENVCEVCGQVCLKDEHGFLPVRLNETAADIRANIALPSSSYCPSRGGRNRGHHFGKLPGQLSYFS
ncbi:hypothetical protein IFM89_021164 [Coptis chinensis]|uniref:STL11/RBM22-like N-terminal domain-containing protein n=1 Tax=Coptis chinensis TaxID=261450 RepID=A0A835LSA6_9MAGN|nr:hypothetical protein IFM89_021164 [Coptis chinensis]